MWDKHVTLGAPGVGLIPLLQDYYAVARVSVRKAHPEVCLRRRCPLAYLHRAPEPAKDGQKGHPILRRCPVPKSTLPPPYPPLLPSGGRWGGLNAPISMFPLPMGREQPSRKVKSELQAMYPLLESLPIREPPSRHYPSVGLR